MWNKTYLTTIIVGAQLAATKGFQILNQRSQSLISSKLSAEKQATFGCGCFWKPAEEILKADGVISTVAGYTGKPDARKAPNYESVCASRDWVEGVRVTYDDEKVSYEDLLNIFYTCQEPAPGSRQYGSFIFPHDEEQGKTASKWVNSEISSNIEERKDGFQREWTQIEPLTKFYQAEGYHQDYWEKQRPRFAAIFVLLMAATGILDPIIPVNTIPLATFHSVCNSATIAVAVLQLLERKLDANVVEL